MPKQVRGLTVGPRSDFHSPNRDPHKSGKPTLPTSAILGGATAEATCRDQEIETRNPRSGNSRRGQTTSGGEALTVDAREVREAADRASGALSRLGWPRLAATVGGRVAQFDCNFETYAGLQALIRRPDGKPYHRESIGRVVRQLRDAGLLKHERVFMGAKMPGAKYPSARGTTLKTFNWRAVFEKNPLSRRQRRIARQQQIALLRDAGQLVAPVPRCLTRTVETGRPRHSVPAPPAPPLDPELAAVIGKARGAWESRRERAAAERPGPVPVPSAAAERPPPD